MTRQQLRAKAVEWFDSPSMNRVTRAIGLVSLLAAGLVGIQQVRFNDCMADWIDENSRITQARTQAASADRVALDQMISAITNATSGTQAQAALQQYLKTRAEADAQRQANPLPEAPSTVC